MKNFFTAFIFLTIVGCFCQNLQAQKLLSGENREYTIRDNIIVFGTGDTDDHTATVPYGYRNTSDEVPTSGIDSYFNDEQENVQLEENQGIRHNNISNGNSNEDFYGDYPNLNYDLLLDGSNLAQKGFQAYPNPVQSVLKVALPTGDPTDIQVFNLIGQRVYQNQNTGTSIHHVDMIELPEGVYFVQINYNGKTETKKIQKID